MLAHTEPKQSSRLHSKHHARCKESSELCNASLSLCGTRSHGQAFRVSAGWSVVHMPRVQALDCARYRPLQSVARPPSSPIDIAYLCSRLCQDWGAHAPCRTSSHLAASYPLEDPFGCNTQPPQQHRPWHWPWPCTQQRQQAGAGRAMAQGTSTPWLRPPYPCKTSAARGFAAPFRARPAQLLGQTRGLAWRGEAWRGRDSWGSLPALALARRQVWLVWLRLGVLGRHGAALCSVQALVHLAGTLHAMGAGAGAAAAW